MYSQPRFRTVVSVAARMAVAPPGGKAVFVIVMSHDATPQHSGPAIHLRLSKSSLNMKSFATATPAIAAKVLPKIALRGVARGESMTLNSRIAAAP